MEGIRVREAEKLQGSIVVQGSKNTVLPIMAATLLTDGVSVIYNCPDIQDVHVMRQLLECLSVRTDYENHTLRIDTTDAQYHPLPGMLTCKLRSSVLLLGPMLAKWKKAEIGMPGGCEIGARPIDIHLDGFMKMNVDVENECDKVCCNACYMQGCEYKLNFPSVGATENLIMAAIGNKGRTILRGVAKEPEIIELCKYLVSLGALIEGIGTDVLIIKGTNQLESGDYINVSDRIVIGTYMLMATAIPSEIVLYNVGDLSYLDNIIDTTRRLGASVICDENCIRIVSAGNIQGGFFKTGIYPSFPTDLQPILATILLRSKDDSVVEETVFENRFGVVRELKKLGANIAICHSCMMVSGGVILKGAQVNALDLRQGAAMVVAGMISNGTTIVTNTEYILRGYENIVKDLQGLGVHIDYI